jgi:hypothetical protein
MVNDELAIDELWEREMKDDERCDCFRRSHRRGQGAAR